MSYHPSTFTSTEPTTLTSDVPRDNPSDKTRIHPLQDRTGLPSLVTSFQASEFLTLVPSVH